MWEWPPAPPIASALRLPDGTILTLGAIADGQFLQRVGNNIVGAVSQGGLLQLLRQELAIDFSTTDTTDPGTEVLSQAITTVAGSRFRVDATVTGSVAAIANQFYQLAIDGAIVAKFGTSTSAGFAVASSSSYSAVLAAGAHTVQLLGRISVGTLSINAASSSSAHATMVCSEGAP